MTPEANSIKIERTVKTLRELSLEKMREAIIDGYFQPGQRLIERALCDELGVSRTIVREVLRHLETEGLVETGSHQGPVVATLDLSKVAEIYEIRALLEGHAARACAAFASPEVVTQLDEVVDKIENAFAKSDFKAVMRHTTEFYEVMFIGGGKTTSLEIVQSLNARINRLRAMTISSSGRGADAVSEMRSLLDAIRHRDSDKAYEMSVAHIRRVADIVVARLQEMEQSSPVAKTS
ncbi:DNA-binding transcriptional regulator, GntR family [Collimonas sp. OK607]|uniref:GntR family transcriptional regulator n=1 Tax=Collimonas sp. OK607 TaxID=1798194 RepID=UPI0008DEFB34|nr:GntR family transcriptional regulator [Collimonas sp. OK607]SFA95069.1 DNA-binding transcriptional regulator, GntR family [Collimonas sp. OK607]